MKKRIRKKKCIGEFKELAFHLSAKYGKLETEAANEFLSRILEKGNELGLLCGGTFEADHFDFYVVSGRINTRNEERRQEMVAFVKSLPGVESVEAGEFVDAWYTPIEDDCCCDHELDDEDFFEVDCPNCGESLVIDDEVLEAGVIDCPKCGQKFALDFEGENDECGCGCDCGCDHDHE